MHKTHAYRITRALAHQLRNARTVPFHRLALQGLRPQLLRPCGASSVYVLSGTGCAKSRSRMKSFKSTYVLHRKYSRSTCCRAAADFRCTAHLEPAARSTLAGTSKFSVSAQLSGRPAKLLSDSPKMIVPHAHVRTSAHLAPKERLCSAPTRLSSPFARSWGPRRAFFHNFAPRSYCAARTRLLVTRACVVPSACG